jgi:hypothetical protein
MKEEYAQKVCLFHGLQPWVQTAIDYKEVSFLSSFGQQDFGRNKVISFFNFVRIIFLSTPKIQYASLWVVSSILIFFCSMGFFLFFFLGQPFSTSP